MKSILLYANDDPALDSRIEAALDLAEADDGHLTCMQAVPYEAYVAGDPFGGVYALPMVLEEIERKKEESKARVENRLRKAQVPWTWLDYAGNAASLLVERSRLADIVVVSLPDEDSDHPELALSLAGDVAIHSRALTLAMPTDGKGFDPSGRALVAWNGSPEASHALRLAAPLLQRARKVDVVTVVEDDATSFPATDACEYLGYYGIRPELHERRRDGEPIASCILGAARDLDAAYIVLGAYGHSRIRESVLGGVTRTILKDADRPLLLGH